ncbi:protein TolR [Sphingorhabdus sp.]|jgi:biopolymer transport protein TolR|uniref:protein TolR n=1 Tax=Sphingorhabdus sp. TaxID=1902408 RepID=UPI0037839FE4
MAMNISSGRSGGRGRRRGGRRAPMADINVTPFVDVMLVLLIIFMVTAPLLVTGVPVELPESRANTLEQPEEPIEIAIDQSGTTFIDGTQVAPSELPARLEEIAGAQDAAKPRQIMLRGDTSISYGQMMRVMGELNRAGLNSVSLVTTGSSGEN